MASMYMKPKWKWVFCMRNFFKHWASHGVYWRTRSSRVHFTNISHNSKSNQNPSFYSKSDDDDDAWSWSTASIWMGESTKPMQHKRTQTSWSMVGHRLFNVLVSNTWLDNIWRTFTYKHIAVVLFTRWWCHRHTNLHRRLGDDES